MTADEHATFGATIPPDALIRALRLANAPCSWGSLEFEGLAGKSVGYAQMLDELAATGYAGTELGDWGYMPTDPEVLREELSRRSIELVGAFVPVRLADPLAHDTGEAHALRVASFMADVAGGPDPVLVLADENGTDPVRTHHAGSITPQMGLPVDQWRTLAHGTERIARAVRDETGLSTAFHHHAAGYVETPDEIARLLDLTDPELVGLVFDTGHYAFGAGDCDVAAGFDRFAGRVRLVHFKDFQPAIADRVRHEGWDYFQAVRHGIFPELGTGCVEFPALIERLRMNGYAGWIVVEQDVLPGMGTPAESAQRNRDYLRSLGL